SVLDRLAIYDTMQFLRCDVATYCVGQAASMAAVLLAGGKAGKRFLLANNRVLLHQPLISGQLIGPATDLDIEAQEILRLRARLYEILANHSGQTTEKVEKDCDRNLWLDAGEAIEYGLADRILQKAPEIVREPDNEH
ncbi:ClpP family protease, partial [Planctomycetota bacterium]